MIVDEDNAVQCHWSLVPARVVLVIHEKDSLARLNVLSNNCTMIIETAQSRLNMSLNHDDDDDVVKFFFSILNFVNVVVMILTVCLHRNRIVQYAIFDWTLLLVVHHRRHPIDLFVQYVFFPIVELFEISSVVIDTFVFLNMNKKLSEDFLKD